MGFIPFTRAIYFSKRPPMITTIFSWIHPKGNLKYMFTFFEIPLFDFSIGHHMNRREIADNLISW